MNDRPLGQIGQEPPRAGRPRSIVFANVRAQDPRTDYARRRPPTRPPQDFGGELRSRLGFHKEPKRRCPSCQRNCGRDEFRCITCGGRTEYPTEINRG